MRTILIWHSVFFKNGGVIDPNYSITFGFLNRCPNNHSIIRHSLYIGGESRIYKNGANNIYKKIYLIGSLPDPIRYISEIIINIFYLIIYRPNIVIAIDPLSCFAPTLLKKIGFIKKVVFITPDFAKQRFNNKLLNKCYFFIDKFCTLNSDINTCCAKTVINHKGIIYKISKIDKCFFHYPNIPNPWIINKIENLTKIKNRIIYVGNISYQINFKDIFDIIFKLKEKHIGINLVVVGKGDQEEKLKIYLKENKIDNVYFLGQLYYEDVLKEIALSEIGIALYNGNFNYDEFRDSCKIREYQALSVIPIASKVVKTNADEILKYESGVLVDSTEELLSQIDKIFSDLNYKKKLQHNAKKNYLMYIHKYEEFNKIIAD